MDIETPHQEDSVPSNIPHKAYFPVPLLPKIRNESKRNLNIPFSLPLYNANPIQAITRFFKKYFVFSGRASRSEFWWPISLLFLVQNVVSFFSYIFEQYVSEQYVSKQFQTLTSIISIVVLVLYIAVFIPAISCACRRFHDCNKSGKWLCVLLPCSFIILPLSAIYGFILFLRFVKMSHSLPIYFYYHVVAAAASLCIGVSALIVLIVLLVHESDPRGSRFDAQLL
ncbi:DUF805 domain-containing protein [Alloscardovia theropitheci]|uniref:DUF805 domain-containing protein n=1 Tax=Alloscardovia theropitheci TaxID=2496842 RepID=UPI0013F14758|nr:DUF805 domain-containing protein [Alloscardovia theropitheci]